MKLSLISKYLIFSFCVSLIHSCSLVKIESEQKPLPLRELNTRLLTQSFVQDASNRIEIAADSILANSNTIETQTNALKWKMNALTAFRKVGFQTSPNLALMDTWTLMIGINDFFKTEKTDSLFDSYSDLAKTTSTKNLQQIEKNAKEVLTEKEYATHKEFAYSFAKNNPIKSIHFKHNPVRKSYLEFKRIPDSLAVTTVGTLSEVVADFSNKMTYTSENTGKQLRWNTELLLKEKGLDSIQVQKVMDSINIKFERLVILAETSPELFQTALSGFKNDMGQLFGNLNQGLQYSVNRLAIERALLGDALSEERIALDSIILRERTALSIEAKEITKIAVNDTMTHVKDMITSILFYLIILLAVIIFLPFFIGYQTGKIRAKNKKD